MEKEIQLNIRINASPERVWEVLTNTDEIQAYMRGARNSGKTGSKADFYMDHKSQESLVVKGAVVRADPPFYLEHTFFPTREGLRDSDDNYLTAIYQIMPIGEQCELLVTQKDFLVVEKGQERYRDAIKGWKLALPKIKQIAEEKASGQLAS